MNKNIIKLEAQWAEPVSLTFHSALGKLNTEPSRHVDASYQVSLHMAKAKKYICVFTVTCQKNLGSVGRDYYYFFFFFYYRQNRK
jgi:hypothetical protein